MGMNIITIDIIPQEVQYLFSNGIWKFEGNSNISCESVKNAIRGLKFKKLGSDYYTDKKTIDLRILRKDNKLIAIRVEGIIKCIDNTLEACYGLADYFSKMFELKFCVLGEEIEFGQYDNYVASIRKLYKTKIDWCENGHLKDFQYVIPPHKFDKAYKHYCKKMK